MENHEIKYIRSLIDQGLRFQNPGGGDSLVYSVDENRIVYIRGSSKIHLKFKDIADVIDEFRLRPISTNDLKEFRPEIFDSSARPAGHSCNCTMIFRIFELAGFSSEIFGKGQRGNPFYIEMKI